jgi:hypothetical protein
MHSLCLQDWAGGVSHWRWLNDEVFSTPFLQYQITVPISPNLCKFCVYTIFFPIMVGRIYVSPNLSSQHLPWHDWVNAWKKKELRPWPVISHKCMLLLMVSGLQLQVRATVIFVLYTYFPVSSTTQKTQLHQPQHVQNIEHTVHIQMPHPVYMHNT